MPDFLDLVTSVEYPNTYTNLKKQQCTPIKYYRRYFKPFNNEHFNFLACKATDERHEFFLL
jgi:hypothetical protein